LGFQVTAQGNKVFCSDLLTGHTFTTQGKDPYYNIVLVALQALTHRIEHG